MQPFPSMTSNTVLGDGHVFDVKLTNIYRTNVSNTIGMKKRREV